MNKKISEILSYLKLEKFKNDKRIVVFSVCLLIAVSLWFLNALGKNYTTTLTYSVKYVNPPENLFLVNFPPEKLELNVQAHGFTLLRHKLAFSFSPIVLDLSAISQSIESQDNSYLIPSETLIRRIGAQVSKEITINTLSPQIIELAFDSLSSKRVPVLADIEVKFKPQHFLNGNVEPNPDSVTVTGPSAVLDTLNVLYTVSGTFEGMEKSQERMVSVKHPANTKVTPEKVALHIPVERFTEKQITLPVQANNKPDGINLKLFPSNVKIVIMVGLSEYENVSANDFKATVDYTQAIEGNSRLQVSAETQKQHIQIVNITPNPIEYLIESE